MNTTILFHKNCNDGLIAALNFYAYYKEREMLNEVIFLPVQYGEGLPDESVLKDRHVYIVDFSYTRPDMAKIVELAQEVTLLDHHESAIHNLFTGEKWLHNAGRVVINEQEGNYFMKGINCTIDINKKRSGATLAFIEIGTFVQNSTIEEVLAYLSVRAEDRDNWVFQYEDSKAVHEYIRSLGSQLNDVYDALFSGGKGMKELMYNVKAAQIRVDMRDELARNYAKLAKPISFMGHIVPAVNVPSDFASIVGDILDKDAPFAVMYTVTDQKILISLRSDKITGVNVQEIAAALLGGGHVNASGASIPHTELASLLKGKIQPGWL